MWRGSDIIFDWLPVWIVRIVRRPWNDIGAKSGFARQRDHNMALSLIGKAEGQNSFGGNSFIDNDLERKTG